MVWIALAIALLAVIPASVVFVRAALRVSRRRPQIEALRDAVQGVVERSREVEAANARIRASTAGGIASRGTSVCNRRCGSTLAITKPARIAVPSSSTTPAARPRSTVTSRTGERVSMRTPCAPAARAIACVIAPMPPMACPQAPCLPFTSPNTWCSST